MTVICRSGSFIFIHIHKTAGTAFKAGFRKVAGAGDICVDGNARALVSDENNSNRTFTVETHSSFASIRRSFPREADDYDVVVLVRDPLARITSVFKWVKRGVVDWCVENALPFYEGVGLLREKKRKPYFMEWSPFWIFVSLDNPLSLKAFIHNVVVYTAHNRCRADPALATMVEQVVGVSAERLRVFKSETDIENLQSWIAGRLKISSFHMPIANDSNVQVAEGIELDLSLDDLCIQDISLLYGADFRVFGYSPPPMAGGAI